MRRLFPGVVALLGCVLAGSPVARADFILTDTPWVLTARDDSGVSWSGSVLTFTSQEPSGPDWLLEGHFDWLGNGVPRGRELFRGTLSDDLHLDLQGFALIDPVGIIVGRYQADVLPDGSGIVNGVWSAPFGIPGTWSATPQAAAVPEPSSAVLLGMALTGLAVGMVRRSRRRTGEPGRMLLAAGFVVLLLAAAAPAQSRKPRAAPPPEDPRLQQIRSDLKLVFRFLDEDKNNHVDAAELARGFRGPDAKPYQPPPSESPGADKDGKEESAKKGGSDSRLPLAELLRKYPDQEFLLRWDQDRDDRIRYNTEYSKFIELVVQQWAPLLRKQDEIAKLQSELVKMGLKAAQRRNLYAQMKLLEIQLANAREASWKQLHLEYLARYAQQKRISWKW